MLIASLGAAGALAVWRLDHALDLGLTGNAGALRFVAASAALTLIFGALTFFPAAALGPIAEHVTLMR